MAGVEDSSLLKWICNWFTLMSSLISRSCYGNAAILMDEMHLKSGGLMPYLAKLGYDGIVVHHH